MGQRVIPVAITAEYIGGDGVTLGAAGSHSNVVIEYDFRAAGPMWDDPDGGTLIKYVLWTNPQGNTTNRVDLGVDKLVDGYDGKLYHASPTADAMCVAGWAEMVVVGAVISDGKEVAKVKTEPSRFRVLPGSSRAADNEGLAATVADQLQTEIEAVDGRKVSKPTDPYDPNGEEGQYLVSLGDGRTKWDYIDADAIEEILVRHPEWVTDLQDGEVTTKKIADAAVTGEKLKNLSVATGKIADEAVTASKLANNAVKLQKLDDEVRDTLLTLQADAATKDELSDAVDGIRQQMTSPYNFKGTVPDLDALEAISNPEQNDTYFVQALNYCMAWTGEAWAQSTGIYPSDTDYSGSLEAADPLLPMYTYRLKTLPGKYYNMETGALTVSTRNCTSEPLDVAGTHVMFRLTDAGKSLMDGGATVYIQMENALSGTGLDVSQGVNNLAIVSGDALSYANAVQDYRYIQFRFVVPSGETNPITDINEYIEVQRLNPRYTGHALALEENPVMYPMKNQGTTVVADEEAQDASITWHITIQTQGAEYVYSDLFSFDYALFDTDGACLRQLTGVYDTCCIKIPEKVGGFTVAKLQANIKWRTRYDTNNLYGLLPWLRSRIWVGYRDEVIHSPVPNQLTSQAIKNLRVIMGLYGAVTIKDIRPISKNEGEYAPIRTKSIPGLLYRSVLKNNVGFGVPFSSYISACNRYNSAVTMAHAKRPMDGVYGIMCAGLLLQLYQDPVFLSTATFHSVYKDKMVPISDLSQAEVGDIIFKDGAKVLRDGVKPYSNHVSLVTDKITIGRRLTYVDVAEAGDSGVKITRTRAPFPVGDRAAYVVRSKDLGITPADITEKSFIPGDAEALKEYILPQKIGVSSYDGAYTIMSFWGSRHVDYPGNLQSIQVKAVNGTPVPTKLRVFINNSDEAIEYNIADIASGSAQTYRIIQLTDVMTDEFGLYRFYADDEPCFELYYYDKDEFKDQTYELDLSHFAARDFDITKTYIRNLDMDETGIDPDTGEPIRRAQYVYRPLTEEEIKATRVQIHEGDDQLLTVSPWGTLFYRLYPESGEDEDEGDDDQDGSATPADSSGI